MDFKTRFQGKTSMITKDGGIETAMATTKVPINKIDVAGNSNNNFNKGPTEQLISFGGNSQSNGFNIYNGNQSHASAFGGAIIKTGQFGATQQQQSQYQNFNDNNQKNTFSPIKQADLDDLRADNIYLKGGNNMAEALKNSSNLAATNGLGGGISIAMRMKQQRDAQQNKKDEEKTIYNHNPFMSNVSNQNGNVQDKQFWAQTTSYSDNSQISQNQTPISSQQSQRPHNIHVSSTPNQLPSQQIITPTSNSKPPSQQNIRKSLEKQRQSNFASVTKQIINTTNNSGQNFQKNPIDKNVSTSQVRQNNIKVTDNGTISGGNSYSQQIGLNQNLKHRAVSVSNTIQQQNENQDKTNVIPKRGGAFRSAGIKSQQTVDATSKSVDKTYSSQNGLPVNNGLVKVNTHNLIENPYQQQISGTNQGMGPGFMTGMNQIAATTNSSMLTPEQLQQQILMMQHQMMLLQQQQQFIYGGNISNLPPQSSPALLQMNPGQPSQDVYKQFELADQKYQEKVKPLSGVVNTNYQSNNLNKVSSNIQLGQSSSTTTSGLYKPYSVKEYKQMQQTSQQIKLGGLGANIGGEDWEKAKKKQEQIQEYAKQLRLQNINKPPPIKKNREEKPKEKTARDKAIEFSKNVPKPKMRVQNDDSSSIIENPYQNAYSEQSQGSKYLNNDLNGIEEEPYDEYGVTLKGEDLAQLNMKHDQYASELEKIKQLIM
ncbi:UNKNOWN [Stylonychia lemnae]|uniref:Uncharacterized protein n=1 Tax=Stylonychia lemnae TaxID=5949 RepID=A0A077ZVR2_STYLE|nr:UNKNOWN [Stylonychia lemnae]|eukprot:CDW74030.1 UNKNOWN [Stylonychia lemnae]